MALILAEGFDAYGVVGSTAWLTNSGWTRYDINCGVVVAAAGRRSSAALRQGAGNLIGLAHYWEKCNLGAVYGTLILGFAFKPVAAASNTPAYPILVFEDAAGAVQCVIHRTEANGLEVRASSAGTLLASSADSVITTDAWQYVEIKIVCDASGSVIIRIDGVEVINQTGIDTQTVNSGGIQTLHFRAYNKGSSYYSYIDDLVIMDGTGATFNDFLGDVQVAGHLPDADGSHTDWTSTEADQHSAVDDVGAAFDDEYIESATEGHKDSFTITPSGTNPGILAVEVVGYGYNTGAGTAKVTPFVIIGGVTYSGTEVAMAAGTSDKVSYTWEKNPATNGLWSRTVLAAAEFGFEVTEIT